MIYKRQILILFLILWVLPLLPCDRSSLSLISVTQVGSNYQINVSLNAGGGITGTSKGADSATKDFVFAFRTTNDIPMNLISFTSSVTSQYTGAIFLAVDGGAVVNAPFDSQGTIAYINNLNEDLECISSTVSCGEIHTSTYAFSFTVNVLPEEIQVLGIEGGGNPSVGCLSNPDMIIANVALPITLTNFYAVKEKNIVSLYWETASEVNNAGFEVQHSKDGKNWTKVGFVAGEGNSVTQKDYLFLDEFPFKGLNYYRLKQIDFDGNTEYSKVITIKINDLEPEIFIFPNPSPDEVNISIQNPSKERIKVLIYDRLGALVWKSGLIKNKSIWDKNIHLNQKGFFVVSIEMNNQIIYKRLVLID